jgi:hypothetical protein
MNRTVCRNAIFSAVCLALMSTTGLAVNFLAPTVGLNGASSPILYHDGVPYISLRELALCLGLNLIRTYRGYDLLPPEALHRGVLTHQDTNGEIGETLANDEIAFTVLMETRGQKFHKHYHSQTVLADKGQELVVLWCRLRNIQKASVRVCPLGTEATEMIDERNRSYRLDTRWADFDRLLTVEPKDPSFVYLKGRPSRYDIGIKPEEERDFYLVFKVPAKVKMRELIYQVGSIDPESKLTKTTFHIYESWPPNAVQLHPERDF